ncbi:MAG: hypothetical protein E6199_13625, partial [Mixta calida]|nr:hypothetical protein [Mixta calida]
MSHFIGGITTNSREKEQGSEMIVGRRSLKRRKKKEKTREPIARRFYCVNENAAEESLRRQALIDQQHAAGIGGAGGA